MKNYSEGHIDKNMRFRINPHILTSNLLCHTHTFVEMMFSIKGKGTHFIDNQSMPFLGYTFYLIEVGSSHEITINSDITYFDILLEKEFFESFPPLVYFYKMMAGAKSFLCSPEIGASIEVLLNEIVINQERDRNFYDASLAMLESIFIIAANSTPCVADTDSTSTMIVKPGLPVILDYINRHFCDDISLARMAELYGYNPSYLSRLFKKSYNISLMEYVYKLRIRKAIKLLKDTDLPISQIEHMVNYNSHNNFYKHFFKHTGKTPLQFRNEQKHQDISENVIN